MKTIARSRHETANSQLQVFQILKRSSTMTWSSILFHFGLFQLLHISTSNLDFPFLMLSMLAWSKTIITLHSMGLIHY